MSSESSRLIGEITERIGSTIERATEMNQVAAGVIGVNATDMRCIQMLQHGPLTAGELARRTGLTTASMTGLIDRLELAGLVARVRDPADRRRVLVELQPDRARSDIAPVFLPLIRAWRGVMAKYDERDLRVIAGFLEQIEGAIDSEVNRQRNR
ncbi:MarR family winged helix-turn-helix transcriptional regulator [Micromonospora sp. SL1-18]|uniref:MarR family winged helix-turn-helix transcriptional regulator n=1 Tax=Micromonospora sp. SL1-18 TaxID=3399128 RepID=UPI003A4DEDC5